VQREDILYICIMETQVHIAYYSSPIGLLEITGNEEGILSVHFMDTKKKAASAVHPSLKECMYQLDEYFKGIRKEFGLKLNPKGTAFQQKVWEQLLKVPFGKTASYLDISKLIGDVKAIRAVGNANGCNPIAVIIPCHRVIGSDGKLVGYGGGIKRKEWLLNHERDTLHGKQTTLF
jgi:methylated-DNA-[protein]-cysteine S-methyltransferase